jgi:UDP-N-acetylmuramate: L-alanyl-gamma-D-glutamyl-meso-diaminopimelate ligase
VDSKGNTKSIHFIGLCGTAMASIAVVLKELGHQVTGSDENVYPPMSTFLQERGITIMAGFSEDNLAHRPDLVVVGNAVRRGNPEAELILEQRWDYCSLPEVIRRFLLPGRQSIVIAGTHGKTTTTSLAAWVFDQAGLDPGFLVGGIPLNFGHGARLGRGAPFIIEGDEYDTAFFDKRSKFVHYEPHIAVLNNIEFDHADIFDSVEAIKRSFRQLIAVVPRNGIVLANGDDPNVLDVMRNAHCRVETFGLGENNQWRATDLKQTPAGSAFRVMNSDFHVSLSGEFNVRNALAVVVIASLCGVSADKINAAFATFRNVKRRLEVRGEINGVTVLDDFAHHPTAIRETIRAIRAKYPGRRLWALFEPRSNTTRRHFFQRELAEALSLADGVFIGKVDRLHELKESERLNPDKLVADITATGRPAYFKPDVRELVATLRPQLKPHDLVAVFSNGKFDGVHEKLLQSL